MSGVTLPSDGPPARLTTGHPAARMAFRLRPATIRAMLPRRVPGTYLLLAGTTPVYVGRSDVCLRTRLSRHNHLSKASHVLWEPARTPGEAFALEAFWFHRHHKSLINKAHPAPPRGSRMPCPFCTGMTGQALRRSLRGTDHHALPTK